GAMFAHIIGAFQPHDFYLTLTFELIAMLVVGGRRSISGAVVGTLLISTLVEVVRPLEPGITIGGFKTPAIWGATQILLSAMILFAMYKRPAGIMSGNELPVDWLLNRLLPKRAPTDEGIAVRDAIEPPTAGDRTGLLATHHLGIEFGGVRALNDVTIAIQPGKIVGLIGPNGAGKTTLINNLTGIHKPTHGGVQLGGVSIIGWSADRIARSGLARTFQNIRLFGEMTAIENVLAAATARGQRLAGIEDYAQHLLLQLDLLWLADRRADTLSYGDQRRLEIARALALEPRFLLLDEPAAGMNPKESAALIEVILAVRRTRGVGILIVEHDLHLIMRLCDEVFVLNKGELIATGSAAQVQNDPLVIEAYLGTRDPAIRPGAHQGA
ncbi:MAG: ATP-binding cassette domain-containing protein, partial [Devosia sp.]